MSETPVTPLPRVRLLKVIVQPVFVIDDGDELEEVPGQPVTVPGKGWREFGTTALGADDLAQIAEQYGAQSEPQTDPSKEQA